MTFDEWWAGFEHPGKKPQTENESVKFMAELAWQAAEAQIKEQLLDQKTVWTNMCRGIIAPITHEQLQHVLGGSNPQWQPISSAPTDEFILMYMPLVNENYEIHLLAITEHGLVDTFNDMTTYGTDDFTHWCSVPKPPTKEGEK